MGVEKDLRRVVHGVMLADRSLEIPKIPTTAIAPSCAAPSGFADLHNGQAAINGQDLAGDVARRA